MGRTACLTVGREVSGQALTNKPLGNYDIPDNWPRPPIKNEPGDVPGPPVQYGPPVDPNDVEPGYGFSQPLPLREDDIYFYHSDHLGSTSYVTDADANPTQFVCYMPFGEAFVDEHTTRPEMPYKFNGKEQDAETGLYYYGARYYDAAECRFLGVDPLAERYYEWYPYSYSLNNPIRFIDPNGMWVGDPIKNPNIRDNRASNLFGQIRTGRTSGQCSVPHQGFDYRAAKGTKVMAVRDGEVVAVQSKDVGSYGKYIDIAINNDDGIQVIIRNAHLDNVDVSVGDFVEEGHEIGTVGTSGNADENDPHLHFEVRTKESPGRGLNNRVNPNSIVDTKFYSQDENANQTLTGVTKVTKTSAGYTVVNQNRNMSETVIRQAERINPMQPAEAYVY